MSGVSIAFFAQIVLGISLVVDKIFLSDHRKRSPLTYTFWLGALNALGILLVPFGFDLDTLSPRLLAITAGGGALFLAALYFSYRALQIGEASHTLTVLGGFTPGITLLLGMYFLDDSLNIAEQIAFLLLTTGGTFMFLTERIHFWRTVPWIVLSSIGFALANIFQKIAFDETGFITGFVVTKAGTFLAAVALLAIPAWRGIIRRESRHTHPRHRALYFVNRALAGAASFLVFYAINLENPAIVEAISGFRYAVIFLLALLITRRWPHVLRETFHGWTLWTKTIGTILIVAGLAGLSVQDHYEREPKPAHVRWGVTFSTLMARHMGIDAREALDAILEDLRPQGIRLVAYWTDIEARRDTFDFSSLDWQMDAAARAGVPVTLVVGQKVPRWPECHVPRWAREMPNDKIQRSNEFREELLEYLHAVVKRYRKHPALQYWQVENEPFLPFGECANDPRETLDREIALVKSLDPAHPVMLTDGGEFGDWYRAAKRADVFGTTMYRKVHNDRWGNITYPLTPEFFPVKRDVVQFFTGRPAQEFVVIELGLEPWGKKQIYEISVADQFKLLTVDEFKETVDFAKAAGFDTYYGWGAEWWYWLKTEKNDDRFWNHMRDVIQTHEPLYDRH